MKIHKKISAILASGVLAFSYAGVAQAHVVMQPSNTKTSAYQTFELSVPTEKNNPTVGIKLTIPENLTDVTPTIKPGWNIQTEKHGEGNEAMVTTITWSGGAIGAGFRDDFTFRAKTPDNPTDLQWKAYQTYQDGTIVSWDQQPTSGDAENEDEENATVGPFSVTKVAADSDQDKALKTASDKAERADSAANRALYAGIAATIIAAAALIVAALRKPKVE